MRARLQAQIDYCLEPQSFLLSSYAFRPLLAAGPVFRRFELLHSQPRTGWPRRNLLLRVPATLRQGTLLFLQAVLPSI